MANLEERFKKVPIIEINRPFTKDATVTIDLDNLLTMIWAHDLQIVADKVRKLHLKNSNYIADFIERLSHDYMGNENA